jgi:hypothetical protein
VVHIMGSMPKMLQAAAVLALLWLVARALGVVGGRGFSLDGKVVVITGAASGIGRRLARKVLAEAENVTLALLDVDLGALEKLRVSLLEGGEAGKRVFVYGCDVSDHR